MEQLTGGLTSACFGLNVCANTDAEGVMRNVARESEVLVAREIQVNSGQSDTHSFPGKIVEL